MLLNSLDFECLGVKDVTAVFFYLRGNFITTLFFTSASGEPPAHTYTHHMYFKYEALEAVSHDHRARQRARSRIIPSIYQFRSRTYFPLGFVLVLFLQKEKWRNVITNPLSLVLPYLWVKFHSNFYLTFYALEGRPDLSFPYQAADHWAEWRLCCTSLIS